MSSLPTEVASAIHRWCDETYSASRWTVEPMLSSGRSAARVWRLQVHSAERPMTHALRDWGWSRDQRDKLNAILRFQRKLFANSSQPIIPKVIHWDRRSAVLEAEDTLWTLAKWLDGKPAFSEKSTRTSNETISPTSQSALAILFDEPHSSNQSFSVSNPLLHHAIQILAELHAIGADHGQRPIVPLGLTTRLDCVDRWSRRDGRLAFDRWLEQREARASSKEVERVWKPLRALTELGFQCSSPIVSNVAFYRATWRQKPQACHWIVGDLWRENILVDGERVTGIIDFGAARIDWSALEIVRWLSSWLDPNDDRLSELLADYGRLRREAECRLGSKPAHAFDSQLQLSEYRALDRLCTLSAFLQWLEWTMDDLFDPGWIGQKMLPRIEELVHRLVSLHC